jgi:hypothetical protein
VPPRIAVEGKVDMSAAALFEESLTIAGPPTLRRSSSTSIA